MRLREPGETWTEAWEYHRYASIAWVARTLPTHTGRAIAKLGGTLAFHVAHGPRAVVAANMAQVLGRDPADPLVQGAAKEAFQLYARYWFDTFHVQTWTDDELMAVVRLEGMEHLHEALEAGTGVIIALPHTGNYDIAGRAVVAAGVPVVAVAERLEPERLYQLFLRSRRDEMGMEVVPLTKEANVGRRLAAAIKANKAIALLADRDLNGRGVKAELFGRERRFPAGPAMISISTGAPIVVAEVSQTPPGWTVRMRPLPEVERTGDRRRDARALIQQMARTFEEQISAAPADWHIFSPGWED